MRKSTGQNWRVATQHRDIIDDVMGTEQDLQPTGCDMCCEPSAQGPTFIDDPWDLRGVPSVGYI
jgi:hypothetical protein